MSWRWKTSSDAGRTAGPDRRDHRAAISPILPTDANDRIFRAITAEVHLLPEWVIDPVVIYYRLLAIMSSLAGDLRLMASAGPGRTAEMFEDYLSLTDETLYSGGLDAMVILSAQSGRRRCGGRCACWRADKRPRRSRPACLRN
jgi:hypothetical protein